MLREIHFTYVVTFQYEFYNLSQSKFKVLHITLKLKH